jgi:AcrR family transcriptional regulator
LREIARDAGLLLGSLQYRFASKEVLLVCLMERAVTRATDAVRAAIEPTRDPLERLRLGMLAPLEVKKTNVVIPVSPSLQQPGRTLAIAAAQARPPIVTA